MKESQNELDLGLGGSSLWGFSPWQCVKGESVLIVGAGDPRHIFKSIVEDGEGKVCIKRVSLDF